LEIKLNSGDIELLLRPRQSGVVITMTSWAAQYGEGDFLNGTYQLLLETADKTGTATIDSTSETDEGMLFILPASLFTIAQRTWTGILKFVLNGKTDFAEYNFDIKVTKPQSVNAR